MKVRAIAREAVIFALVGLLLAEVGGGIFAVRQAKEEARSVAFYSLHATPPTEGNQIDNSVRVPLTDGTVLYVTDCDQLHAEADLLDQAARERALKPGQIDFSEALVWIPGFLSNDCVGFYVPGVAKASLREVHVGDTNQIAIEKQYWRFYLDARHRILGTELPALLFVDLLGFPAGLVVWLFYRLVRFAVKG